MPWPCQLTAPLGQSATPSGTLTGSVQNCYHMVMTSPLVPATVQGSVVQPTATIDAKSEAAHGFLNVVRDLVHRAGAYHTENEQIAALNAVDQYARSLIPQSTLQAIHEESPGAAPLEDVTLRVPPLAGGVAAPVRVQGQPIDYDKLAAALVAAQRAAAAQSEPVDSGEAE